MTTMENHSKRLSMNTSLKNAGIFEEDSWDEDKFKSLNDHNESLDSSVGDVNKPECKNEIYIKEEIIDSRPNKEVHIKEEIKAEYGDSEMEVKVKKEVECIVKKEEPDSIFVEVEGKPQMKMINSIKEEVNDEFVETERKIKIKKEEEDDDEEEDEFVMEIPSTPIKTDPLTNGPTPNPSPFTKDLFTKFTIESPGGESKHDPSNSRQESLKSYKRTVFSRHSPYKRDIPDYLASGDERRSVQDRLGPKLSEGYSDSEDAKTSLPIKKRLGPIVEQSELPKKKFKRAEKETDSATLARRQKQIDYGKNTIAYDNYIRKVDRKDRAFDDPMTPNKQLKYSRRAWDGLIKQWRLRLHKYDTE